MLTPEQMVLIVTGAQLPLLVLAFVLEFSRRKARPIPPSQTQPEYVTPTQFVETPPVETVSADLAPEAPQPETIIPETPPLEAPPSEPPPAEIAAPEIVALEIAAEQQATSDESLESIPIPPPAPAPLQPEPAISAPIVIAAPEIEELPPAKAPARIGLGLRRTRENFLTRIRAALTGSGRAEEIYEGLEEALIAADVGVDASLKIIEAVRGRLKNDARADVIRDALKDEIERILSRAERPLQPVDGAPWVIMLAGVNGVGKTTTIAKLAARLKAERGAPIVVAAADTFRAAAIEQLQVWCDRVGADLIKQKQGSDPAAVAFDAVKAATARNASTVLIDTAGRLQTKVNLMEELKKIRRVIGREMAGAPHETWLVLDANTGQNALSQAKLFGETAQLTGVVLAKLDSTAKGGVIIAIAETLKLPVRFVGTGEDVSDLQPFDGHEFVNALFSDADSGSESASRTYAA